MVFQHQIQLNSPVQSCLQHPYPSRIAPLTKGKNVISKLPLSVKPLTFYKWEAESSSKLYEHASLSGCWVEQFNSHAQLSKPWTHNIQGFTKTTTTKASRFALQGSMADVESQHPFSCPSKFNQLSFPVHSWGASQKKLCTVPQWMLKLREASFLAGQLLDQFTSFPITKSVPDNASNAWSKYGHDRPDIPLWLSSCQQVWEESFDPSTAANSHRQSDNHLLTSTVHHKKIPSNVHQQWITQNNVQEHNDSWTKWESMWVFYSRVKFWPLENHLTWRAGASLIVHTMLQPQTVTPWLAT